MRLARIVSRVHIRACGSPTGDGGNAIVRLCVWCSHLQDSRWILLICVEGDACLDSDPALITARVRIDFSETVYYTRYA